MTTKSANRPFNGLTLKQTFLRVCKDFADKRRRVEDARVLDEMPAERLADMGLTPRTEANRRSSGDLGAIPRAELF